MACQAAIIGRITFIMCIAALEDIILADAKIANWGYELGADRPGHNLKFIDCGGLDPGPRDRNITVRDLTANLRVMLDSVPQMNMPLKGHALWWIEDATSKGSLPDVKELVFQGRWGGVCVLLPLKEVGPGGAGFLSFPCPHNYTSPSSPQLPQPVPLQAHPPQPHSPPHTPPVN